MFEQADDDGHAGIDDDYVMSVVVDYLTVNGRERLEQAGGMADSLAFALGRDLEGEFAPGALIDHCCGSVDDYVQFVVEVDAFLHGFAGGVQEANVDITSGSLQVECVRRDSQREERTQKPRIINRHHPTSHAVFRVVQ